MTPSPSELEDKSLAELHELAASRGVPGFRALRRAELIEALAGGGGRVEIGELEELEREPGRHGLSGGPAPREEVGELPDPEEDEERDDDHGREAEAVTGVLDIVPDGFGFVRVEGFHRSRDDVFVSRSQIRALGLRPGDEVTGAPRRRRRSERHASLAEVETVNGRPAGELADRPDFSELTAAQPAAGIALARDAADVVGRMLELVARPARGGRMLISGPPRVGSSTLLRAMLEGATRDSSLVPIVLLVDARPEEATEWSRSASYPVHASPADRSADSHVELATVAIDRARRLVEQGDDVLLALDSISRLARAFALGRSRSRGEDPAGALQLAKRWFAAGRNTEEAGSLTIVATVHTRSDASIEHSLYEELVDLATAEARLDPELGASGLEPPLDVRRSFSRPDGALAAEAEHLRRLHGSLESLPAPEAWNHLAGRIRDTESNERLLAAALGVI
jgi:transcription termination factor Rho